MPFVSGIESVMNSLLRGLLGALDSSEREVVSGDLLEAHESPSASVLQVLSLIVRRQLIHWAGWQPWLVLTTVAFPLAVVLSQTARDFAGWSAVYSWMLINNTDAALLRSAGFWYGAREYSWAVGKSAFIIFCCSWACGRLIAQLSRNTRLSMAMLFLFTSLFVNILGIPGAHALDSGVRSQTIQCEKQWLLDDLAIEIFSHAVALRNTSVKRVRRSASLKTSDRLVIDHRSNMRAFSAARFAGSGCTGSGDREIQPPSFLRMRTCSLLPMPSFRQVRPCSIACLSWPTTHWRRGQGSGLCSTYRVRGRSRPASPHLDCGSDPLHAPTTPSTEDAPAPLDQRKEALAGRMIVLRDPRDTFVVPRG